MMIIPLIVENKYYAKDTVVFWTIVWEKILGMAYENKDICSEIITLPGRMVINRIANSRMDEEDHIMYYSKKIPNNHDEIIFDKAWEKISKQYGAPYDLYIIPKFTRLHVPRSLFKLPEINAFFKHSFPNCIITFWGE